MDGLIASPRMVGKGVRSFWSMDWYLGMVSSLDARNANGSLRGVIARSPPPPSPLLPPLAASPLVAPH